MQLVANTDSSAFIKVLNISYILQTFGLRLYCRRLFLQIMCSPFFERFKLIFKYWEKLKLKLTYEKLDNFKLRAKLLQSTTKLAYLIVFLNFYATDRASFKMKNVERSVYFWIHVITSNSFFFSLKLSKIIYYYHSWFIKFHCM